MNAFGVRSGESLSQEPLEVGMPPTDGCVFPWVHENHGCARFEKCLLQMNGTEYVRARREPRCRVNIIVFWRTHAVRLQLNVESPCRSYESQVNRLVRADQFCGVSGADILKSWCSCAGPNHSKEIVDTAKALHTASEDNQAVLDVSTDWAAATDWH